MEQTKKLFSQKPSSYWRNSTDMPTYPALEKILIRTYWSLGQESPV